MVRPEPPIVSLSPAHGASPYLLRLRMLAHRLNFRLLEEDAAAMSLEGWEADDLQIRVDLRAVIYALQRFAEQRCTLVDPQPLVVNIGKCAYRLNAAGHKM